MTVTEQNVAPAPAPLPPQMPGWHIVTDLTPPELIEARRVKVIRFIVVMVVGLVLVACVGGFFYARSQANLAQQDVTSEQAITASLQQTQRSYSGITALQGSITGINSQIAALMAADVDVPKLLADLQTALPTGMTINQIDIEITASKTSTTGGGSGSAGGPGSLDASGAAHIGTITVGGTGTKLADLATYIDRLAKVDGIFDPFPLTNQATAAGTTYTLQLTLTDALLTNRYATTGGK